MAKKWYRVAVEDDKSSTCTLFTILDQALIHVCKLFIEQEGSARLEEIVHSVVVETMGHNYDFKSPIPPENPK